MRLHLVVSMAFAMLFVVGCKHNRLPHQADASYPATANILAQVRMHAQNLDPTARVGLVVEADPRNSLVAVGDVNVADFRPGQIVSFVDSRENVLTSGTVVRILQHTIHVKYDQPTAGHRAPRQGDIMIRFKQAV